MEKKMAIATPQLELFQEFAQAPTETTDPLRVCIIGPNARLHRYDNLDERPGIRLGAYDRTLETNYTFPGRSAGGIVDTKSIRLVAEDALLLYHEDLIGDNSGGRGVVAPVAGKKNRVRSDVVAYADHGDDYPRSGLLRRDVKVGDVVYIRGVANVDTTCDEVELWTSVAGLVAEDVASEVGDATSDDNNQESTTADVSVAKIGGPDNCVTMTADGSAYSGLVDGYPTETYRIEVIKSSVAGCNAARLRVTSASGTDNQEEVTPEDFGTPTAIGARGLEVTFAVGSGSCSVSASLAAVDAEELIVGQVWEVTVTQDFEEVCATSGGTYTGESDDTYIVEVLTGGTWSEEPTIRVTTVRGLDFSGPTVVTGPNEAVAVGRYGVTISFGDCYGSSSVSIPENPFAGDDTVDGLCAGDKYYISVTAASGGYYQTIVLRHDLPVEIRDAADLDLRLFLKRTLDIPRPQYDNPPNVNYEIEETQIVVQPGILLPTEEWVDSAGTPVPLVLFGATLYLEYREWLAGSSTSLQFTNDLDAFAADTAEDIIHGQLDEDNPLKWGVFRALQNSGGTTIGYIAVANPDDPESWASALGVLEGKRTFYNLVPVYRNRTAWDLIQTYIGAESSPGRGNYKAAFFALQAKTEKLLVGQSDADTQALTPTSTDGELVLATLEDDPDASGTQYTILSVPDSNANFLTYGVRAGDVVRYLYVTDAWGEVSYDTFVVDEVLSENSLRLLAGHTAPISVAQKIEVWRPLNKEEIKDDLKGQAQSWADRRICAVWPDRFGTGGNSQDGVFLCAALGGYVSGVHSHRSLTNAAIAGVDDLTSRVNDFFTTSQLDDLDDAGVWICYEDEDGTPVTRNALTTDTTDLNRQQEMVRRNFDAVCTLYRKQLQPLIGRANATATVLAKISYLFNQTTETLQISTNEDLGPRVISATIKTLQIHPLAADTVELVADITLPRPLNTLRAHFLLK
jgi:hypothetical protein